MKFFQLCQLYFALLLVLQICGLRYTNEFLVKFSNDEEDVEKLVTGFGLTFERKFGRDVYKIKDESLKSKSDVRSINGGRIGWFLERYSDKVVYVKQLFQGYVTFGGPVFHHVSSRRSFSHVIKKRETQELLQCEPYYDMGIEGAWSMGYTGNNVTIAVVDVGADITHQDLMLNFDNRTSYSFFDDASNLNPQEIRNYILELYPLTDHGNNMACLIAAQNGNGKCSSGVAFNASLSVLKAIKFVESRRCPSLSMKHLADALSYKSQDIDVYSCSFTTKRPFKELREDVVLSLEEGTAKGRQGRGNLFVVPAGDNKYKRSDCNVDPFVNSLHTITIGSVGVNGSVPPYAIPCACTVAAALGDGHLLKDGTMISCSHFNSCTNVIDGVSTATAIGAAIIGLTLQANKQLTWRDVLHIIIKSASLKELKLKELQEGYSTHVNGAGLEYNPFFGFGLMNATQMVLLARNWTNVPEQIKLKYDKWSEKHYNRSFHCGVRFEVKENNASEIKFASLEHVVVDLEYESSIGSHVELILISPRHTRSVILSKQRIKKERESLNLSWKFTSVHFWGEDPYGTWKLRLVQLGTKIKQYSCGKILRLSLILYGIPTADSVQREDLISENENVTNEQDIKKAKKGIALNHMLILSIVLFFVIAFIVTKVVSYIIMRTQF